MKTYEFTVVLVGQGDTEEDAWQDACDCFERAPGDPKETRLLEDPETPSP
jgi:hypothetical protein